MLEVDVEAADKFPKAEMAYRRSKERTTAMVELETSSLDSDSSEVENKRELDSDSGISESEDEKVENWKSANNRTLKQAMTVAKPRTGKPVIAGGSWTAEESERGLKALIALGIPMPGNSVKGR